MERATRHGPSGNFGAKLHAVKASPSSAQVPGHRVERQAGVPGPAQAGTGTPAAGAFDRLPVLGVADLAVELTGHEVHADTWLDSRNERTKLQRMTETLAARLREGGVEPLRKSPSRMCIVGVCTGKVEEVTQYRNINFLPSVASANRSQVLKRMNYFAESHRYLRYAVVTNGARCPVGELRPRLCSLARSISNFAALPALRALGISVQFRGSEFTARRDVETGEISYHPHANLVFDCSRRLSPDLWRTFLKLAHDHFPGHWRDCGRLGEAAEAVKYCTKPAELLELDPDELCALALAVQGLHLVQSMGAFAALGRQLDEGGVKLGKRLVREDWQWCLVRKAGRVVDAEKAAKAAASRVEVASWLGEATAASCDRDDLVLAVMPPQPRFVPRLEPCLLIMNYSGNFARAVEGADLGDLVALASAAWAAALTSTPARQLPAVATSGEAAVSPVPPGEATPSRAGSHNSGVCRVGGALGGKVGVSGEVAAETARPASRPSGGKIEAAGNGRCGAVELLNA